MTILHFTHQKFIDFLKEKGCVVVSDVDWEQYDRVMFRFGDITFPLQMQKVYYYFTVCKICKDMGIDPPDEFKHVQDQIRVMNKNKKGSK